MEAVPLKADPVSQVQLQRGVRHASNREGPGNNLGQRGAAGWGCGGADDAEDHALGAMGGDTAKKVERVVASGARPLKGA